MPFMWVIHDGGGSADDPPVLIPPASAPTAGGGEPTGEGLNILMRAIPGLTKFVLKKPFLFQTPPLNELRRTHSHSHGDYDTLGLGQMSRPGGKMLATITFDTLVVDWDAPWAIMGAVDPQDVADEIVEIVEEGFPFALIIGNPSLWPRNDFTMAATLRSVDVIERSGEVDARYLGVQFTEFRSPELMTKKKK